MFFILLFLFSAIRAQTLTIANNTGNPILIKNGKKEVTINNQDKKEFTETDRIEIKHQMISSSISIYFLILQISSK